MPGSPPTSPPDQAPETTCCGHDHSAAPGQDGGGWVRALAVATFDVGTGHTLEEVYPADSLDDGDRQRIRMLAMPDCNTTQIGDCFYCFRTRKSHRLPLLSSSLLDQHFEYCYAFFRQERNQECARGMFQKSVVLVSRYPYVNLFERLVKVIGPLYFSHGPAVLEAVFASVEEWPAPCPGSLCPLPFLSETIMFQVPDIDMPPQVASKYRYHRGAHLCSLWPRSRVKSLTRTLSGCGSVDFQISSPTSRRESGTFSTSTPEEQPDSVEAGRRLGGSTESNSSAVGGRVRGGGGVFEGGVIAPVVPAPGGGAGLSSSSSGLERGIGNDDCVGKGAGNGSNEGHDNDHNASETLDGTPVVTVDRDAEEDEWGQIARVETPAKGGRGASGALGPFWSGTARTPGVLVSPGLQLSVDGGDGGHQRGRSSLGSGSLASVICDSPSETWLTTPRNGSTPLLALDGSGGSNLAQSCYYVADRDSEEDDEEAQEDVVVEGWQGGGEGAGDDASVSLFPGRLPGAGEGQGVVGEGPLASTGVPEAKQAEDAQSSTGGRTKVAAMQAAYSAAATAASLDLESRPATGQTAAATASNTAAGGPSSRRTEQSLSPSPNTAPAEAVAVAAAVCASRASAAPPAEAPPPTGTASPSASLGNPAGAPPALSRPSGQPRSAMVKERATSLSPTRSTPVGGSSGKTGKAGQTQIPKSAGGAAGGAGGGSGSGGRGRWSGLRAWADAAPEDPWDAPPPLATEFVGIAHVRSKSATCSAAGSPAATAIEMCRGNGGGDSAIRSRGATSGGRGGESAAAAVVGQRGDAVGARKAPAGEAPEVKGGGARGCVSGEGGKGLALAPASAVSGGDKVGVRVRGSADGRVSPEAGVAAAVATPAVIAASTKVGESSRAGQTAAAAPAVSSRAGVAATPPSAAAAPVGVPCGSVHDAVRSRGNAGGRAGAGNTIGAGGKRERGRVSNSAAEALTTVATGGSGGAEPALAVASAGAARGRGGKAEGEGEGEEESGGGVRALVRKASYRLVQDGRPGRLPTFTKGVSQDRRSIHRSASNLQGGRSPFAEMLLADEARFRAKQGLFQSIGLYSIFGKKLVEHLWLLWELVLTASPTLVVGSSVGASSAAILGMVSLASPVYFGGDFRPHFTTFDPDYREIVAAHDSVSKQQIWGSSVLGVPAGVSGADGGGGFPSMLLGVINPIFLRTLSRWPNAIVLPGAAGRSSNSGAAVHRKLQHKLAQDGPCSSPKNRNCPTPVKDGLASVRPPPVRVQVVRAGASLDQVVAQDDRPNEPIIVARQQPVMVPDVSVLCRLLDPGCPYNPTTAAAAAAAASAPVHGQPPTPIAGVVAAAAAAAAAESGGKGGLETKGQWKDSLRAINDIILRRHFADLTRCFLAPFDKYFRRSRPTQPLSAWQQRALGRLSVYTDAEALLPRFDEDEFLTEMFVAGPPKSFAHVQWETLYRRFMDSPNFRPWFTTQRIEGVERIREMNRVVCLRTTPQGMVEACAPARLPQLLGKIKASIAREWRQKGQSVDWELLERMELHQKAVEGVIVAQSSVGTSATGSVQP